MWVLICPVTLSRKQQQIFFSLVFIEMRPLYKHNNWMPAHQKKKQIRSKASPPGRKTGKPDPCTWDTFRTWINPLLAAATFQGLKGINLLLEAVFQTRFLVIWILSQYCLQVDYRLLKYGLWDLKSFTVRHTTWDSYWLNFIWFF